LVDSHLPVRQRCQGLWISLAGIVSFGLLAGSMLAAGLCGLPRLMPELAAFPGENRLIVQVCAFPAGVTLVFGVVVPLLWRVPMRRRFTTAAICGSASPLACRLIAKLAGIDATPWLGELAALTVGASVAAMTLQSDGAVVWENVNDRDRTSKPDAAKPGVRRMLQWTFVLAVVFALARRFGDAIGQGVVPIGMLAITGGLAAFCVRALLEHRLGDDPTRPFPLAVAFTCAAVISLGLNLAVVAGSSGMTMQRDDVLLSIALSIHGAILLTTIGFAMTVWLRWFGWRWRS